MPENSVRPLKRLAARQRHRGERAEQRRNRRRDRRYPQAHQGRLHHGAVVEEFAVPAQRPAAPHRDQPRGVERIDHEDHDRQIQKRKPERQRDDIERRQSVQPAGHQRRAFKLAALQPVVQRHRRQQQHQQHHRGGRGHRPVRLVKNSSHRVWPIISELEPASRSGITNSPTIGMKQSNTPAPTPGNDSGNVTSQNACRGEAPRSPAASSKRRVHLGQRRIERQDHERQIGIDDAEIHRAVGGEPHHRRETRCSASRILLSRPSCCRMLIQA